MFRRSSRTSCVAAIVAAFVVTACGKKGPPLAPIIRIPAPIAMIHAQRSGSDAFITVTVPTKNIDGSIPVDIGRIEIYGYTGRRPPPNARWVEVADLVATIPVLPPPLPGEPGPDPLLPVDLSKGAPTGAMVTVRDVLTPQKLVQGKIPQEPARRAQRPLTPVVETNEPDILRRFYMAIAFSARGRPGPPGTATDFALVGVPEAPAYLNAFYTDAMMNLAWAPSGGILGFLFDALPLPPEDPPLNDQLDPVVTTAPAAANTTVVLPSGPVKYNVYREVEPDPFAYPALGRTPSWMATTPAPINPAPLLTTTFTDTVEFDRQRCYVVRAVRGIAPNIVEGDPSPANCLTPVDVFPPAPPARLVAVADEGGISLIWEPSADVDVAGYMVLRGDPSDATLQPLTPAPVEEPRFRDTHVSSGKKYVYAVAAVDARLPVGNVSIESNRVEETAR